MYMAAEERSWHDIYLDLESEPLEYTSPDRYSVLEEIGRGGAKIVFKAVDNNSGREVAYCRPIGEKPEQVSLFLREARITAYLQHPNILPVYDVSGSEKPFFVCKLLRGEDLSKLRVKSLRQQQLLSIFRKICEAVEYAHSRGVIHLDLKPENVRLDKYGEVLVIDWGLAEIFCNESIESPLDNPLISQQEIKARDYTALGTPGYMSPEQVEGNRVDTRSDVFSLGAILYYLFQSKPPFKGGSVDDIFDMTVNGDINFRGDLSSGLKSIISKCLSVDPQNRYSSVSELIDDVEAYENDYAPEAENAGLLRNIQLLYRRNKLIFNLLLLFIILIAFLSVRYIRDLKSSRHEAMMQKENAEKYLGEVLEQQKQNEALTKALSPRYFREAFEFWQHYKLVEAREKCAIALQFDNTNKDAKELMAKLLIIHGNYDEAVRLLKDISDVNAYITLINRLRSINDISKSVLIKASASAKQKPVISRILLESFRTTGNMECFKRVIRMANYKMKTVNVSFRGGELDLSNNPLLSDVRFLGGLHFTNLNLRNTGVSNLSFLKDRKLGTLDISNSEFKDFFSLENMSLDKLIIEKTIASSLWPLSKVKIKELVLDDYKGGKIPNPILNNIKLLSYTNSKPVSLTDAKDSRLEKADFSGTKVLNPEKFLQYKKLKEIIVSKENLEEKLLSKFKRAGIKVTQSNSSFKR